MKIEDIIQILHQGEGLRIEFKEAKTNLPKSFFESVVSFSNTDGGTVLLGVGESGEVSGLDNETSVKFQKDIITALNNPDCVNPPIYVQPEIVHHPDGKILVIQCPASSQVHEYAGRIFIREYESDLDVTDNQHKISELYFRKRNFFTEAQIFPNLAMDDLDPVLFQRARVLIRNCRSDHPWLLVNDLQLLKDSVLWRKDFMTGQEGLTLAAALIFGKDNTIQSLLPAYKVEAIVRIKNKHRWDDRIIPPLRTNLIDTYLSLKTFVNKHMPEKFFLEGDQRIDLRDKIFRELIGNVIVHREYTSALPTELIINECIILMTNPNKPIFHGPIDPLSFNPYPKNPNIRKFFTAFGWTDEIGSGIRNTNLYLPLYIGGGKPIFWENEIFKTEIPLRWRPMSDFTKQFQTWLELPDTCLPHLQDGLKTVSLPPELTESTWMESILHLALGWITNGTKYPVLRIPVNQSVTVDSIKKVPGWSEKSSKLFAKRFCYLLSILVLAGKPIKRDELMGFLDYENRKSFNDLYLRPLLQVQFLKRTNQENPNDPGQKYYLSEEGKNFLSGLNDVE